jgi:outer membrane protein
MQTLKIRKLMLIVVVIALGSVGLAGNTLAQAAPVKIGFVDLQEVISKSAEGQQAKDVIQKKADELKVKADQMKVALDAALEDFKQKADLLTADARRTKQDELEKQQVDYDRFVKDSRDTLAKDEERALKGILQEVGKVVVEYGQKNGFTVILEAGNILYGADNINLTDEIVKLYNSRPKNQ